MTPTTEAFDPKKPTKIEPGSELHFALLATPMGWNFLTGKDYADMQAFAKAVWDAATERAAKQERETEVRLVWAMNHMGLGTTHADFCSHVLRRGGTGDYGDCTSFIDAAIRASGGSGASDGKA
jgi:hypothetical protein